MAWLAFSIPGGVLLLVAVGMYEKHRRRGTGLAATYINEVTAMFYGTKRMELDHRNSIEMMRDEDAEGAPPLRVDLDQGVVFLRPNDDSAKA
ncbi:MAG TPA: DUF6191 domain-containing protein [Pseudonocardiaceae bacterium]|nr:DUF6191 domain-containing protein [Pseudonocardiaceae bacterium]